MKYLILIFIILTSCLKKDDNDFYIFKIKKGSHKSAYSLKYTDKNVITFNVKFDSSSIYETIDPINQYDVNKLFGISDGKSHIKNSARFGWRYVNNKLELMAYTHFEGIFHFEKICNIEPNKEYTCQLSLEDTYVFRIDTFEVKMPRFRNESAKNYYLYPYFGGDETAPHDITIKIKF